MLGFSGFDAGFYVERYPDVARSLLPPFLHYQLWGRREGRRPHPLHDVLRFLEPGARGMLPPWFDAAWHARLYPGSAGSDESALRSCLERSPAECLDLLQAPDGSARLAFRGAGKLAKRIDTALPPDSVIPVFAVYGPAEAGFVRQFLIPRLATQKLPYRLALHLVNYDSNSVLEDWPGSLDSITDWSPHRPPGRVGFGEAVNFLFAAVQPAGCFFLVNPDSYPLSGCMARLLETYSESGAAVVEARQWPQEHPKEFDPSTRETPWASAAFCLISSAMFRELGGFDPAYFMYLEDVDLSWRAWLNRMAVHYEPRAVCCHSTGFHFRHAGRRYAEDYFSSRNFLALAYKFFGALGEQVARDWLRRTHCPPAFERAVVEAYELLRPSLKRLEITPGCAPPWIRINGFAQFHDLRPGVLNG